MSSSKDNSNDRDRGEKRRLRPRLGDSKKARMVDGSPDRQMPGSQRAPGKRQSISPDITDITRCFRNNNNPRTIRSQNRSGFSNPYTDHSQARRIEPNRNVSRGPTAAAGAPHQLNNELHSDIVQPTAGSSLPIQGQINVHRADSSGRDLEFSTNAQINVENHGTGVTLPTKGVESETETTAANEQAKVKAEESSKTSGGVELNENTSNGIKEAVQEEDNDVYVDAREISEELIPHSNAENESVSNSGTDEFRSNANRSASDSDLDAVSEKSSTDKFCRIV